MPSKRKGISKRLRFDIFRRDGFCCRYCGQTPPVVVLNIDHIHPVSKGGTNDIENLITACYDCNSGKSDKELDILPTHPEYNHKLLKERHDQYKEYQKTVVSFDALLNIDIDYTIGMYKTYFPTKPVSDAFRVSVKKFILGIGSKNVFDAMDTAISKDLPPFQTLRYFCGICWNMIKNNRKTVDQRKEDVVNG